MLLHEKHVTLSATPEARDWLAQHGFDPQMGARPMARVIQDKVKRPLADELLFGKLIGGGRVSIDVKDDELVVTAQSEPERLLPATVD
jgi:ATP-dependent Clp protease ATP-binding subunit ClpA